MDLFELDDILRTIKLYIKSVQAMSGKLPFLISTLVVMVGIYLFSRWRHNKEKIGFKDAMRFLFPKEIFLHKSSIIDFKFSLLDPLIRHVLFSPALQIPISTYIFIKVQEYLILLFGDSGYQLNIHEHYPILFAVVFTILTALLKDLGFYFQHNLMHRVPFLWEFHKVHHSASVLTPFTDNRVHPMDLLSMPYFSGILLGTLQALLDFFLTSDLSMVSILGINALIFAYYSIGYNLRHSHIPLSFGWHLSHVFMSPSQHHVHHSKDEKHYDKNFGSVFSFWDWVFGTLYVSKKSEKFDYGLSDDHNNEYSTFWKMYLIPFKKNLRAGRVIQVLLLAGVIAFFAIVSWAAIFKSLSRVVF